MGIDFQFPNSNFPNSILLRYYVIIRFGLFFLLNGTFYGMTDSYFCVVKNVLTGLLLLSFITGLTQSRVITVLDKEGNFPVSGVVIQVFKNDKAIGFFVSDAKGVAEVNIPVGEVKILVSHLNYETEEFSTVGEKILLTPKLIQLDDVVVTGQYNPQSASNSLYKVKSISSERIEKIAATEITQLFQHEPNIRLSQDGAMGTSNMEIQGMGGRNIKIMIDGVPLIGLTGDSPDLDQINIQSAEKVEIISGPMAVSYGSNALGGVVNIITKDQGENMLDIKGSIQEETVGNEYGIEEGKHLQYLSGGYGWDKLKLQSNISHNYFGGFQGVSEGRAKDWHPKNTWQFGGKVDRKTENSKVGYHANYMDQTIYANGNLISPFTPAAFDEEFHTRRLVNTLLFERKINNGRINTISSYTHYRRDKNRFYHDLISDEKTLTTAEGDQDTTFFNTFNLRGSIIKMFNIRVSGEFGYDINLDKTTGGRILEGAKEIQDYALYSSMEWNQGKMQLRPGLRIAHNSIFKAPLIPSLHFKYNFSETFWLRSSYGRGFRAPSLRELYFEFVDTNHNIVGNENLSAEYSNHLNLSLGNSYQKEDFTITTDIELFYNHIFDMISMGQDKNDATAFTFINIDEFTSFGSTWSGKLNYKNILMSSLGFTAISWKSAFDNQVAPDSRANIEVLSDLSYVNDEYQFSVSLFYKYNGKETSYYIETDGSVAERGRYPYHWMDMNIRKGVFPWLKLEAGIRNLLDVERIDVYSVSGGVLTASPSHQIGTGRSFFIKLSFENLIKTK